MNNLQMEVSSETEKKLPGHYRDSVTKFLKTVVVFDDQAFKSQPVVKPVDLEAPDAEFDDLSIAEFSPAISLSANIAETVPDDNEDVAVEDEDHELDGPGLVKLFAKQGIVCSIIEPDNGKGVEPIVSEIVSIAPAADVLVLDWELQRGDSTATLSAIKQILMDDKAQGGRLRFIVIYTAARVREVVSALKRTFTGDFSKDGDLLKVGVACVVVLNKPSIAHVHGVELSKLPDKIFDLHAQFSSGLLPSVALSAIGTIRNHTHQILGQFRNDLDAAFITHRALIPKSEDAEAHLIELVADTFHHLMLAEGVRASVSNELCTERLLQLYQGQISEEASASVKDCVSTFNKDKLGLMVRALGISKNEKFPERKIIEKFYPTPKQAEDARKAMAFLHDFTRSHVHKISSLYPPRLSMGTIIAVKKMNKFDYYMCIQPRCDSIRFDGVRSFPFTKLSVVSNNPNIHFLWSDSYKAVRASEKVYDIVTFDFGVSEISTEVVEALLDESLVWTFSVQGAEPVYWVGDLRKDKAQRLVSKIASRLHLPGINEYELTRQD
jgi:hypothetical protein